MNLDNIIITNHAKLRAEELHIDPEKIKSLLIQAKPQMENPFRQLYKFFRYGNKQKNVSYYYRKGTTRVVPLLFTIKEQGDKFVILTVTKKKL